MTGRAVFITPEPVDERMAGPAIRMLELARAVGAVMQTVVVSLTRVGRGDPGMTVLAATSRAQLETAVVGATALVVQGDVLGLHPWMIDLPMPIVVDVYDPFHLEQLQAARPLGEDRRRAVVRDCVTALNTQLARADFVLCASARQRSLWLGHLAALGRVNPATYDDDSSLRRLLAVVPFGADSSLSAAGGEEVRKQLGIGPADPMALWGGGVYPWFDVDLLVRAMAALRADVPAARLVVLGGGHPVIADGADVTRERAKQLAAELGVLGHTVLFPDGWVQYDDRHRWLNAATVGVSTHLDHLETEFSFRTRCLDYLAAGLPIITSDGDAIADLVRAHGCGQVVGPGDLAALTEALRVALTDHGWLARCGEASFAIARDLHWAAVAAPLVEFCLHPRRAPDLAADPAQRALLGVQRQSGSGAVARVRAALLEGGPGLVSRRVVNRVRRLVER